MIRCTPSQIIFECKKMEEIPYYIASFLCIKNLFEVVCITHNGLHKVKLVMILIFLVFVNKSWTRLGGVYDDKTNQRGKLLNSERNLISMVERVWIFKDKYENNRKD